MERRTFLKAAVIAATTPTSTAVAPIAHAAVADPLLDMITAYRNGLADFNANAPEDNDGANAYGEISWLPPFKALENWTAPATTREGAIAALRLAVEEGAHSYAEFIHPLTTAALAYFEQEGAR
jgi:hypothetical protein